MEKKARKKELNKLIKSNSILKLIHQAKDIHDNSCLNPYCETTKNDFCYHCPYSDVNNRIHDKCEFCI